MSQTRPATAASVRSPAQAPCHAMDEHLPKVLPRRDVSRSADATVQTLMATRNFAAGLPKLRLFVPMRQPVEGRRRHPYHAQPGSALPARGPGLGGWLSVRRGPRLATFGHLAWDPAVGSEVGGDFEADQYGAAEGLFLGVGGCGHVVVQVRAGHVACAPDGDDLVAAF